MPCDLVVEGEFKIWTLGYFLHRCRQGHALIFDHLSELMRERCFKRHERKTKSQLEQHSNQQQPQLATLKYSVDVLSRLCAAIGLWVPAFLLDTRHVLEPTRRFVLTNYLLISSGTLASFVGSRLVLFPVVAGILPKLPESVGVSLQWLIWVAAVGLIVYGLGSVALILHNRHYTRHFLLYQCSAVNLPEHFQRRHLVGLFVAFYWFNFLAEPLFGILSVQHDVRQPAYLPQLDARLFAAFKLASLALATLVLLLMSAAGLMIPMTSCYLIVVTTRHLKDQFAKQLRRWGLLASDDGGVGKSFVRSRASGVGRVPGPSARLVAHLDDTTRRLMRDFSCDTLTWDWPEPLSGSDGCSGGGGHHNHQGAPPPLVAAATHTESRSLEHRRQQCSSGQQSRTAVICGLLFMHRNLLKSLSEMRAIIRDYERHFGGQHASLLLLNCVFVALWLTAALTGARQQTASPAEAGASWSAGLLLLSSFEARVCVRSVVFVISNLYTFYTCDCLPDHLDKMRAQLFMMNIKLGLGRRGGASSCPPPLECASFAGWHGGHDQIWALHDQLTRLCVLTNFKLTSSVYYSKRCLLDIFGRFVSLLVLCIQVIDMYAYTYNDGRGHNRLPSLSGNGKQ